MLTNVPSTLRTPVGIPRSIPTLYACRARVPAPVPMIILWLGRLATSSSITGNTADRPRSIMLWPPILTTLASGRIRTVGCSPVRSSNPSRVSESSTSASPNSVRSESSIRIPSPVGRVTGRSGCRASADTARRTPVTRHPHPLEHVPLLPRCDLVQISELARSPALNLGQDSGTRRRPELLSPHRAYHPPCIQDLSHRGPRRPCGDATRLDANGTAGYQPAECALGRFPCVSGRYTLPA